MSAGKIQWSYAAATMPGETESGDCHWAHAVADGMLFAAIDGLGHGGDAAYAARIAVAALERHADQSLVTLVKQCHESLLNTRGAALSVAHIDTRTARLTWIGVGNVEGILIRSDADAPRERLLLRSGVVGYQLPFLQHDVLPLYRGDTLILTTDGVLNNFERELHFNAPLKEIAERILATANKGTDDALVLVVRYEDRESP